MTFNDHWVHTLFVLRVFHISIHRKLDQNRFINECVRKKELKFRSFRVSKFFVSCRRTYILNSLYQNIHCPQFAMMIHRYLKQLLIIRRDFKIFNILWCISPNHFVYFQKLFPMATSIRNFLTISRYFLRGCLFKLRDRNRNCIPTLLVAWRGGEKGGVCYFNFCPWDKLPFPILHC